MAVLKKYGRGSTEQHTCSESGYWKIGEYGMSTGFYLSSSIVHCLIVSARALHSKVQNNGAINWRISASVHVRMILSYGLRMPLERQYVRTNRSTV